jgi:quercetin dioxygenase-like cupin family protein
MEELTSEELTQRAARLVDWADYQKGSIVSRKMIQKETGSATFFAFDQGQELSTHSAPYDALVYLVDGEAEIQIDDERHRVLAGQVLMLPANRPHAVKANQRFKMLLIMIRS